MESLDATVEALGEDHPIVETLRLIQAAQSMMTLPDVGGFAVIVIEPKGVTLTTSWAEIVERLGLPPWEPEWLHAVSGAADDVLAELDEYAGTKVPTYRNLADFLPD